MIINVLFNTCRYFLEILEFGYLAGLEGVAGGGRGGGPGGKNFAPRPLRIEQKWPPS
jgi:hypothetical protein